MPDRASLDCLAGEILAFVAADTERLQRFLDLTGLTPQTIRRAATQPDFAASLFDYLVGDERLLLAYAAESGRDPREIEAIRQSLAASRDEVG